MLIPTEWLNDFVEVSTTPEALADRLTVTGNEIEEIRETEAGTVFYLKLTPNRPDMLSIRGAGREIAALYEKPFREVEPRLDASGPPAVDVRVEVEAPDLCPRYAARIIRGVKVGPSPEWMRRRLEAAGLRAINNVVDVTNYVMLELGQPLHAFDLDLLDERRILVRRARPGEKIVTIDGTEAALEPGMLVIADGSRPVAVAGVMGGQESEVSDGTTDILLESAYFDPVSVRRTSKRLSLASAASYRFERGVDPEGVLRAADRAAALIAELAGGTVSASVFDVYPTPIRPVLIRFRPQRCRQMLGAEIPDAEMEVLLRRLGLHMPAETPDEWEVTGLTGRPDLAIEEDLIEEVGRLYGYDRLPETLPGGIAAVGRRSAIEDLTRRVREQLLAQGLYEAVSSTLVARSFLALARLELSPIWPGEGGAAVPLRNPLSEEFDTLRPSLLPGLLMAAQYNLRRGQQNVFLFETGYGHSRAADAEPRDRLLVAGLMLGTRWSRAWNAGKELVTDFYAARGAAEGLIGGLGLGRLEAERAEHPALHPGRSAWLSAGGARLGIAGELHPEVAEALDLPRGVYVFELDGETLLRACTSEVRFQPPSRYPRALRDLAVVVDAAVESGRIERILREALGDWAKEVRLFDAFTGGSLPVGKVSLAYALELGAEDRTLTQAEVDARLDAARERLRTGVGAEFRG